jgi:hypothetical protein
MARKSHHTFLNLRIRPARRSASSVVLSSDGKSNHVRTRTPRRHPVAGENQYFETGGNSTIPGSETDAGSNESRNSGDGA